MSTTDYEIVKVLDPRLNVENQRYMTANVGPSQVSYQKIPASAQDSHNPRFIVNCPTNASGLDRQVFIYAKGKITIKGTGANLLGANSEDRIAFRQFPLQSCMKSTGLTFNGQLLEQTNFNQLLPALTARNMGDESMRIFAGDNATPDYVANYNNVVSGTPADPFTNATTLGRSVGSRTFGITGINAFAASGDNPAYTDVTFEITEPLIFNPFSYTKGGKKLAIFGLQTMELAPYYEDIHRMLSIKMPASGVTIDSIDVTFETQELHLTWITLPKESAHLKLEQYLYDFPKITDTPTTIADATANVTTVASTNQISLSIVPSHIIIACTTAEARRSDFKISDPDVFFPITSLNMQVGNSDGIFNGASHRQLYNVSVRGGLNMPFWQWSGRGNFSNTRKNVASSGGPMIIDVSKDLHLPVGVCPGMNVPFSFRIGDIQFKNTIGTTMVAKIHVIVITPGIIQLGGGKCVQISGGIDAVSTERFKDIPLSIDNLQSIDLDESGYSGGGILAGGFWDTIKKGLNIGSKVVSSILPGAAPLAGLVTELTGGDLIGGRKMKLSAFS